MEMYLVCHCLAEDNFSVIISQYKKLTATEYPYAKRILNLESQMPRLLELCEFFSVGPWGKEKEMNCLYVFVVHVCVFMYVCNHASACVCVFMHAQRPVCAHACDLSLSLSLSHTRTHTHTHTHTHTLLMCIIIPKAFLTPTLIRITMIINTSCYYIKQ
jgi:hypothetical protein